MKICASVASTNADDIPTSAVIHIQKIAPGPPTVSATATPAMLPVPTRLASPVANAWNDEMLPGSPLLPTSFMLRNSAFNWIIRNRNVNHAPAPSSSAIST